MSRSRGDLVASKRKSRGKYGRVSAGESKEETHGPVQP